METKKNVLFHEEQRFRQWWLWAIIAVTSIVAPLMTGLDWLRADSPERAGEAAWGFGISAAVGGALLLLFLSLRLTTELRRKELFIRFFPLHWRGKTIPLKEIASCEARVYRPLLEYGGWGIRWGISGKAYNVSGKQGVQLVLKDGKRLLIGSQRAEELSEAIHDLLAKKK